MANWFAIVVQKPDGQQRLELCELHVNTGRRGGGTAIYANVVQEMHRVVGQGSFSKNGATIETFQWLKISLSGRYVATYAHEIGVTGFFNDHNIKIFDLHNGTLVEQFNEHTFSANRASCASQVFEDYLDALRAVGYTESDFTSTDYELDTEEEKVAVGAPGFYWLQNDSFVVEHLLGVLISGSPISGGFYDEERFNFRFEKTATGWSAAKDCNRNPGPFPKEQISSVRVGPPKAGLANRDKVHVFSHSFLKSLSAHPANLNGTWGPLPFRSMKTRFPYFRKPKPVFLSAEFAVGRPIPKQAFRSRWFRV